MIPAFIAQLHITVTKFKTETNPHVFNVDQVQYNV